MKKKQRCLLNRFAALVAALMLCASLCVPCFASNNAQWGKWVIIGEQNMTNEMGTQSRYLHLTPYVNGQVYATPITTRIVSATDSSGLPDYEHTYASGTWALPQNYPAWMRSDIPLGGVSYIQVDHVVVKSSPQSVSTLVLYVCDSRYAVHLGAYGQGNAYPSDVTQSGSLISSDAPFFPLEVQGSLAAGYPGERSSADFIVVPVGASKSYVGKIQSCSQLVPMPFGASTLYFAEYVPHNLTSSNCVLLVMAYSAPKGYHDYLLSVTAEISFWVDANKLPSGLQVGDEFPADTDAFDQLRDDLIKQFPEAAENIENGKATIQGWNDTETVDTDVASTSISALNALFQNLGGFLFIVSLMVFGAVVLRMLIRKAVDG